MNVMPSFEFFFHQEVRLVDLGKDVAFSILFVSNIQD
jgi:hypothetical protein